VITVVHALDGSRSGQLRTEHGERPGWAAKETGRSMPCVRSLYLVSLVQVEVPIAVIGVKREPYGPCLAERLLRDHRPQATAAFMFRRPRKSPPVLATKSLAS
jgi:hypothetical protein